MSPVSSSQSAPWDERRDAASDVPLCLDYARNRYPRRTFDLAPQQGGCSLTLLGRESPSPPPNPIVPPPAPRIVLLQFRPPRHALPIALATQAARLYPPLAPATRELGPLARPDGPPLQVCEMAYLPGVRLSDVLPTLTRRRTAEAAANSRRLIRGLAAFFATGWRAGRRDPAAGRSPSCTGRVGATLRPRLARLARDLPTAALRRTAREARRAVCDGVLDALPSVLTHGDLLPSNILVRARDWELVGLVDWAEAEVLPFGLALYGLEHVLGRLGKEGDAGGGSVFVWCDEADDLREYFWTCLRRGVGIAAAALHPDTCRAVRVARVVGILLWHGFAWDGGRIDRVVDRARDADELAYLEAFLSAGRARARCRL